MKATIITVGTGLLTGQVLDVNSVHIAEKLTDWGIRLIFRTMVGDDENQITDVIKTALTRSDLVVVVGGLGSGPNDFTRKAVAQAFSRRLSLDEALFADINEESTSSAKPLSGTEAKGAFTPEGSIPIMNPAGGTPGFFVEEGKNLLIALPDSPKQTASMLENVVIPFIEEEYPPKEIIKYRLLKMCGVSQSKVMEAVDDLLVTGSNPSLGLWSAPGEVGVRITASAPDMVSAGEMIEETESQLLERLGDYVYGTDNQTLEEVVGYLMDLRGLTIAVAESCTGGLLAHRLTTLSGSSRYFMGGITSNKNEANVRLLGVPASILEEGVEVSEEATVAMSEGIRSVIGTDLGVGITGIIEPTGETPEKPVGLVYIALSHPGGTDCREHLFSGSREEIKYLSTQIALEILRRFIVGIVEEEA